MNNIKKMITPRWLIITAIMITVSTVGIIFSGLNVSLSTIQKDLHTSLGTVQWTMNVYGILIASTLVMMGRLSDIFGRRKIYIIGSTIITAAMLLGGLAPSATWVIVAMALVGLAGGILLPVSQALVIQLYPPEESSTPIGIWASISGISLGAGVVLAGLLLQVSWRWLFLCNFLMAAVGLVLLLVILPQDKAKNKKVPLDMKGTILLILTISTFVLAIMEGHNWQIATVTTLYIASAICLTLLLIVEKKAKSPIIREDLFKHRTFMLASIANASVLFITWSMFFMMPLYLQKIRGFTPLEAGIMMLSFTIPLTLLSPLVGRWYQKVGPKLLITSGMIMLVICIILQLLYSTTTSYLYITVVGVTFGIGWGLSWNPTTTAAITSLPQKDAGIAAGTFITLQEIGGTVGLAITGTVLRIHSNFISGYIEGMVVLLFISIVGLIASTFIITNKIPHGPQR